MQNKHQENCDPNFFISIPSVWKEKLCLMCSLFVCFFFFAHLDTYFTKLHYYSHYNTPVTHYLHPCSTSCLQFHTLFLLPLYRKQTNRTKQIPKLTCTIYWGYNSYFRLLFTSLLATQNCCSRVYLHLRLTKKGQDYAKIRLYKKIAEKRKRERQKGKTNN